MFQQMSQPNVSQSEDDVVMEDHQSAPNSRSQSNDFVGGFTLLKDKTKKRKAPLSTSYRPQWLTEPIVINNECKSASFDECNLLHPKLKLALQSLKYTGLFPVQLSALKCIVASRMLSWLRPRDLAVCAATGSGKTLAFLLPILQLLLNRKLRVVRCVIVLPVRDLAKQVFTVCKKLLDALNGQSSSSSGDVDISPLSAVLLAGVVSLEREQASLVHRNFSDNTCTSLADIIICTPGRLVDHLLNTQGFSMSYVQFLVMDEADRTMSEQKQDWYNLLHRSIHQGPRALESASMTVHEFIHADTKLHLQKLLFSATLTQNPELLHAFNLFRPQLISASSLSNVNKSDKHDHLSMVSRPAQLKEFFVEMKVTQKPLFIIYLLKKKKMNQILCFTNSKDSAHRLSLLLALYEEKDITCKAISARLPVEKRSRILAAFGRGEINVLVSSDTLARGIDLPNSVECVVCYDAPMSLKAYIHRSGRTARAGASGTVYSLLERKEVIYFKKTVLSKKEQGRRVKEHFFQMSHFKHFVKPYNLALNKMHESLKHSSSNQDDSKSNAVESNEPA